MTLIGAWIKDDEQAFAWADSEFYRDDIPVGHTTKIFANRAGVVGSSAGYTTGSDFLRDALTGEESFDEVVESLSGTLRQEYWAAADLGLTKRVDRFEHMTFVLVGKSRRHSRMCIATMKALEGDFEPRCQTRGGVAFPYVIEFDNLERRAPGCGFDDFVPIARAQMGWVKREVPSAGAGTLTVMRVMPPAVVEIKYNAFASREVSGAIEAAEAEQPYWAVSQAEFSARMRADEEKRIRDTLGRWRA